MPATLIDAQNVDAAWTEAVRLLRDQGEIQPSRIGNTRELRHVCVTIQNPIDRVVSSRPISPAFGLAELLWILSGGNDPKFLAFWNKSMLEYVDTPGGPLHGAYGWRLGCSPDLPIDLASNLRTPLRGVDRLDQLRAAKNALSVDKDSRQVVLQIWNPNLDLPDPRPKSKDVPCNVMCHLLRRSDKLDWLQISRSMDVMLGMPYDIMDWTLVHELMSRWLGVEVGTYTHMVGTLHAYQEDWAVLDASIGATARRPTAPIPTLQAISFESWQLVLAKLFPESMGLLADTTPDQVVERIDRLRELPVEYQDWFRVLAAEALRRRHRPEEALRIIAGTHDYWRQSWMAYNDSRRTSSSIPKRS